MEPPGLGGERALAAFQFRLGAKRGFCFLRHSRGGASHDALALIENRPSFKQAAAAFGAPGQSSSSYPIPRRYVRVPLESPLRAQIEGSSAGLARVKTISLGGAYLESPKKLTVGDSIKLEVRTGLRKINFTAVVRNIGQDGNGIEFVHMRDEDRERLRKFVQRHLQL